MGSNPSLEKETTNH